MRSLVGILENLGIAVLMFIVFVIVGIVLMVAAVNSYEDFEALSENGIETRGTFVDRRIAQSVDSEGAQRTTHFVTFTFQADGQDYTVEEVVMRQTYETAANGEPLSVLYAADDPQLATIEPLNEDGPVVFVLLAFCWNVLTWGAAFVVGFFYIRQRTTQKQRR